MQAKSLLVISVGASALLGANPALSQSADIEAQLTGLHQSCDGGDRSACIQFGFILGENSAYQAEWRQLHPDWWAWAPAAEAQDAGITAGPPELPVYEQPPIPAPGYIWTPGYWAHGGEGYFWVPGTWVQPPTAGLLWTPGYWGWRNGGFAWNAGYWGPHVGFYGGINYGFGYAGVGYEGGRWNNGVFHYNQTVNNFGAIRITNVYREDVVVRTNVRVSFNGGTGGIEARPTPQEEAFAHEQHTPPTAAQSHQQQIASTNKALFASENHGRPAIAATAKPGEFTGKGVVAAREAPRGGVPSGEPLGARPPGPNPSAARPLENPNEARKPEPAPGEAKRFESNPGEARKPEPGPGEAKRLETNPAEAKKPAPGPGEAKRIETNPGEGSGAKVNPGEPRPSENRGAERELSPKPPMPEHPKPPEPHTAASAKPHPEVAHPPAKPIPPEKDKKEP
jgi:hypothetical protein